MCSIGEEDFGDEGVHGMTKDIKALDVVEEMCKKCSVEKCVIKLDNLRESMCSKCFLYYVRHKFRASLGCSKIVRRHSNVLINFQGNSADVCLVHMINFAIEEEIYKRLCFELQIIYLDESCVEKVTGDVVKWRFEKVQNVREIVDQFPDFSCYYSSIGDESIKDIKSVTIDDLKEIVRQEENFKTSLESIRSLTARQDYLENKRTNSLRCIAEKLNCSYVFLSDVGIDLAKKLISNIALGRGSSASYAVSFCDDKVDNVKFIRPIRDLTRMDIENYIKFNDMKTLSSPSYGFNMGHFASIQNLTSQFIDGLQENYSSTVSTVYKCCNKIAPIREKSDTVTINGNSKNTPEHCSMCKSYLDFENSETLYAVEFSRQVSEVASDVEKLENLRNIQDKSVNARNGDGNSKELCHGCRNILSEMRR